MAVFTDANLVVLAILAFGSGVLSFLNPCTLPILPAYFVYGFKSSRAKLIANTFAFFIGFSLIFSLLGLTSSVIGNALNTHRGPILTVGSLLIIAFGILEIFGKGFSGLKFFRNRKQDRTAIGSFTFGILFSVGFSACIGPILGSLLILAANSGTAFSGFILLFIYSMGLGVPLILLSVWLSRQGEHYWFWRFLKGKELKLNIGGKTLRVHSTNLISGLLLILVGIGILTGFFSLIISTGVNTAVLNVRANLEDFFINIL